MTRGMVKSKSISVSKWVIRSQAPGVVSNYNQVCSSSTKCGLVSLSYGA